MSTPLMEWWPCEWLAFLDLAEVVFSSLRAFLDFPFSQLFKTWLLSLRRGKYEQGELADGPHPALSPLPAVRWLHLLLHLLASEAQTTRTAASCDKADSSSDRVWAFSALLDIAWTLFHSSPQLSLQVLNENNKLPDDFLLGTILIYYEMWAT